MPVGSDNARHVERDMAASASSVQEPVAALEPRVFEELEGCLAHGVGEEVEPPLALFPAGDRITAPTIRLARADIRCNLMGRRQSADLTRKRSSTVLRAKLAIAASTTASGVMPKCWKTAL